MSPAVVLDASPLGHRGGSPSKTLTATPALLKIYWRRFLKRWVSEEEEEGRGEERGGGDDDT